MDAFLLDESADASGQDFAQALEMGRRRAFALLEEQQHRIDALEAHLAAEIEQLIAEAQQAHSPLDQKALELRARELQAGESTLAERLAELAARETTVRLGERAQATAAESIAVDKRELTQARERLEKERDALAAERAELTSRRANVELQRRRIARKLKTEWAAQRDAIQRRKSELRRLAFDHHDQLQAALAAARVKLEDERKQKAHLRRLLRARGADARELRRGAKRVAQESSRREQQLAELKAELKMALELPRGASTQPAATASSESAELPRWWNEQEGVDQHGSCGEKTDSESEAAGAALQQKFDDLQRRFEMAVSELRQYKHRNAELEEQLGLAAVSRPAGALDWEARKQLMLTDLEHQRREGEADEIRVTIEGAIHITDEVIAQKDREIAELKIMLDQQSSNLGSLAVGAAAIAEILDSDELVRQERARLEQLQAGAKDKLRQAEIEIAIERASLARAWAQLEDRLARCSHPAAEPSPAGPSAAVAAGAKKGGVWRAFLGLKDSPGGP